MELIELRKKLAVAEVKIQAVISELISELPDGVELDIAVWTKNVENGDKPQQKVSVQVII